MDRVEMQEYGQVTLLAFVDSEVGPSTVSTLERIVAEMRDTRSWVVGPPEVVDDEEDGVRTLGILLILLSPRSSAGYALPVAVDRALLGDVQALVDALRVVSAEHTMDIGFEMDGEAVGWIEQGVADELLEIGMIGEWAAQLGVGDE